MMMKRFRPLAAAKPPVRSSAGMQALDAAQLRHVAGGPGGSPTSGPMAGMRPLGAQELRQVAGGPAGSPTCLDGH